MVKDIFSNVNREIVEVLHNMQMIEHSGKEGKMLIVIKNLENVL